MQSIMGGSTKENGLEIDIDQGQSTWEATINDRVPETQSDHLPNSPQYN